MGVAYGFSNYPLPKQEFIGFMPDTREAANTPSDLELTISGIDEATPPEIAPFVEQARAQGITYVLTARLPNTTHQRVAGELEDVLNLTYSHAFYTPGSLFKAAVLFENNGKYEFRRGPDGKEIDFSKGVVV